MIRISVRTVAFVLALAPAALSAQASPAPAKEKRICKSSATIGTLVETRTCHTAAEWAEISKANDAKMQKMRQENIPGSGQSPQ